MNERTVQPKTGLSCRLSAGQEITIVDLEGKQVVDFFAVSSEDEREWLSAGVTIDVNESLYFSAGDTLYSNRYRPMFQVARDDVGRHDLLHPCCRKEMYDFFYHNGKNHPNCLDNINARLSAEGMATFAQITPVNLFMNTVVTPDGKLSVRSPLSRPGDKIVLRALLPVTVALAACSVSESECNGGNCTPIQVVY